MQAAELTELGLDLQGTIEPRCELTDTSTDSIRFDVDTRATLGFDLYCNVEMSLTIESTNGGLLNVEAADRRGTDESLFRRYTATVAVDSLGFTETRASRDLVGGVTFDLGNEIAFASSGRVAITLDEALGEGYAGEYTDEIRLSIFPSLATFN